MNGTPEAAAEKLRTEMEDIKREMAVLNAVGPTALARIEDRTLRIERECADRAGQVGISLSTRIGDMEKLTSDKLESMGKAVIDHETRIRQTEQWRYSIPLAGVALIISAVGTAVAVLT